MIEVPADLSVTNSYITQFTAVLRLPAPGLSCVPCYRLCVVNLYESYDHEFQRVFRPGLLEYLLFYLRLIWINLGGVSRKMRRLTNFSYPVLRLVTVTAL